MKYWKDKEVSPVEKMNFWKGDYITKLEPNEVFVFGANPQARHFAGAAKAALGFGAVPINVKQNKPGIARGLSPNNKTYALITKSLEAGYTEPETGITYHKEGFQSVSPEQIRANIDELYETAKKPEHLDKKFLVTYQYESWPNGTPKKSLNGYTSQEMLEMFVKDKEVPPNIVFHESYKPHLEKLFKKENRQSSSELVVYENDKTIDIKEENIVWTIDSNERNPEGIHGAGGAKAAMTLGKAGGAKNLVPRGMNGKNTYALVTKVLDNQAGTVENGITYTKTGYCSVSPEQIRANIDEMYDLARTEEYKNKKFLISYQYESWPNGTPKKSLNGYTSQEMLEMFVRKDIPENIVFHDSYKPHLEKALVNIKNKSQEEDIKMQTETELENKPKEYTFFFHLTSPFSNFHPSKFEYKEFTFVSNEQFMMFSKAKTFKDEVTAQKIIDMNNQPLIKDFIEGRVTREQIIKDKVLADQWNKLMMKTKGFGREVKNYDDAVWSNRRDKVVLFGAREKFTQNEDLKQILLATGNTYMVEASPYDKLSTMQYVIQKLKEEFSLENKRDNKLKM